MTSIHIMFQAIRNFIQCTVNPGYTEAAFNGFIDVLEEMVTTRICEVGLEKFNAENEVIKLQQENGRLINELESAKRIGEGRKYFSLEDSAVRAVVMDHIQQRPDRKIEAIVKIRQMTNCGLKEAKDYSETFDVYKPVSF